MKVLVDEPNNTIYISEDMADDKIPEVLSGMENLAKKQNSVEGDEKKEVKIVICSYGGDLHSGLAIIDGMRELSKKYPKVYFHTRGTGSVFSTAFLVLVCGDVVSVSENTLLHFHGSYYDNSGKTEDHRSRLNASDILNKRVKLLLLKFTNWTEEFIDDIDRSRLELYYTADELRRIANNSIEEV